MLHAGLNADICRMLRSTLLTAQTVAIDLLCCPETGGPCTALCCCKRAVLSPKRPGLVHAYAHGVCMHVTQQNAAVHAAHAAILHRLCPQVNVCLAHPIPSQDERP